MEVSDFHLIYIVHLSYFSSSLLFSMASFLIAFLLLCFEGSSVVTLSLIGSLSGVIAVIVVWCIWTSWEKHPIPDAQSSEKSLSFEGDDDDSEGIPKKFTFEVMPESSTTEEHYHWPSVLGLKFALSFNWPSFIHRRRHQSYDSNGTVVEDP